MTLESKHSPWGTIDHEKEIIPGIVAVSTPGHGGLKLDSAHNAAVPAYMRRAGGWYEEDCEWAIPFVVFENELRGGAAPTLFGVDQRPSAPAHDLEVLDKGEHLRTFRSWFPDEFERFTGQKIQPGESYIRDEQLFAKEHANDLQVCSAWGDWQASVPAGMVGVCACVGGRNRNGQYAGPSRYFLIPVAEYDAHGSHFIVDPARHQEVEDFTKNGARTKQVAA